MLRTSAYHNSCTTIKKFTVAWHVLHPLTSTPGILEGIASPIYQSIGGRSINNWRSNQGSNDSANDSPATVSFNANLDLLEPINGTLATGFTFPRMACNAWTRVELAAERGEPISPGCLRSAGNKYIRTRGRSMRERRLQWERPIAYFGLPSSKRRRRRWLKFMSDGTAPIPAASNADTVVARWRISAFPRYTLEILPAKLLVSTLPPPGRTPFDVRPPSRLPKCFEIEFAVAASIFIPAVHPSLACPFRISLFLLISGISKQDPGVLGKNVIYGASWYFCNVV